MGLPDAVAQRRARTTRMGLSAIAVLVIAATAAYVLVEGWSVMDALYMVVITLSTVGFREVAPLSPAGRLVTIVVILTGVAAFAYAAAGFARLAIEGELRRVVGRRRMDREISRMRGHVIICGYGRVGREVCQNLMADGATVVVIDLDEEALTELDRLGVPYVHGDAVDELVMLSAGIGRASALLLALSHEADNVYVTLLARDLRDDLTIVARSTTEQGERRLMAAGANRVVSPERIGARSMSNSITRPSTVDFTEIVTARESIELQLEEVLLSPDSRFAERSISECDIRRDFGLIVVGIRLDSGEMVFNPAPDYRLLANSTLILLGRRDDVRRFADGG